jgi:hypothetical protein
MIIKDGAGTGNTAQVTAQNQLRVLAAAYPLAYERSRFQGDTYTLAALELIAVGASGTEILATIKNTSATQLLVIDSVLVTGYDAHGTAQIFAGSVSGDDGTAYTPLNHNRTSGRVASATVYVSDATLTATGGTLIMQKGLSPETPQAEMMLEGTLLLGLNDTMDVRFLEQAAATPNVGVIVVGFYVDV